MIKPIGYNLLLQVYRPEEKTESGILVPLEYQDTQQILGTVCKVVALGPDAYKDKERYPEGPWCEVGEWVIIGRNAGVARFEYEGDEYRIMPDDKILAKVDDPKEIKRI